MYIPAYGQKIESITSPQIRLLLLGRPGTGKTYSVCTTFPSPVVADFDNGCQCIELRKYPITLLPFHSPAWCKEITGGKSESGKDVFKWWLNTEARKLEADQTLFIDSLSGLADEFHNQTEKSIPLGKTGKEDGFFVWNEKDKYMRDIHLILKGLRCHVVVSAHEKEERNEFGMLSGKVSPLLTGGFGAKLGKEYSDIVRALSFEKETGEKDAKGNPVKKICYAWQVQPDDSYDLKSRITHKSKYVVPGFKNFEEYFTKEVPATPTPS